jgi:hypothetical protein
MGSWESKDGRGPYDAWQGLRPAGVLRGESETCRGVSRTELTVMHDAWRAGRIGDDMVRAALPLCWVTNGSTLEAPETLAMLQAVGPLSDSPERPMPERFCVYQGRPAGEALGIAWSPEPQEAVWYGKRWQAVRKDRDSDIPAVVWTGIVRASDVLLLSRLSPQVIVPPEAVTELREITDLATLPATRDLLTWRFLTTALYLAALERGIAGLVRYLIRRLRPEIEGTAVGEMVAQRLVRDFMESQTSSMAFRAP